MDKKTVYLETSVVSYLANRPSRDLIVAAHQAVTREWWEGRRHDFTLFVSEPVLDEAGGGDPEAAAKRLASVNGIDQGGRAKHASVSDPAPSSHAFPPVNNATPQCVRNLRSGRP
jgi:hypothetical protein